jgi:hypothetical protein
MLSHGFVEESVWGELAGDAEPHQRQRVGHALAQRPRRVLLRPGALGGEQLEPLAGELGVGQRPGRAHPGTHLVAGGWRRRARRCRR